jgi:RND family efflux transporter MFP subunit
MDARRVRRIVWIGLAAVLMLGAAGMTWRWQRHRAVSGVDATTTYYCPMHTDYHSDKPGNCPICSMKLVPLTASPVAGSPAPSATGAGMAGMPGMPDMPAMAPSGGTPPSGAATAEADGPPTIQIPPERQQQIGVKFAAATLMPAHVEIRATGKVAPDETRIAHIHTKVSGWIDEVFVNYVGQPVRKGQPLFTLYSPDLVASQEEYLLALRGRRELKDSPFAQVAQGSSEILAAARRRLELWDMTPAQIKALETSGKVSRTVTVFSAVSGVVTERAAYHHGRTVTPDLDLYTIVDLSRVWVLGQVYEYEMEDVKVGQVAEIELPYEGAARTLTGRVTFIAPFLDPKARTVEVRMEFANPALALKPESFVNIRLRRDLGPRLVVPRDAVMDAGRGQYVFVDKGEGYLEPRPVKAGAEVDRGRVITEGLREGERVATAANFILDSESRLKGAFEAMGRPQPGAAMAATAGPKLRIEVATSPSPAKVGKNTVRVKVMDPSGQALTDAAVEVRVFMPQMGSMAPMEARATLQPESAGQYAGEIEIPMAWTWETTVTVRKGGQVLGTSRTSITAR